MGEGGGSSASAHDTAGTEARRDVQQGEPGKGPGESAGMADEDLDEGVNNASSRYETPGAGSTSGAGDDGSSRCFRC